MGFNSGFKGLKQILKKMAWNGFVCLKINDSGGTVWTRDWILTSIKGGKLLDCGISDFRRQVVENCALLGYYATSSGNFLPTFRHNLSVPSSGPLKMGPTGCPETSVRNNHYWLRNSPEERRSQLLDHLGRFSLLRTSVRLKGGEGCLMSSTVYRPGEVKVRWLKRVDRIF